ncbi:MAG: S8 family serine peptidase [Chloroflexi bacterium]|nr:S8 family serine peptidase [Chloroflexota bacterium]
MKNTRYHRFVAAIVVALAALVFSLEVTPAVAQRAGTTGQHIPQLTEIWAVELTPGTDADALAAALSAENLGAIQALPDHYVFRFAGSLRDADRTASELASNTAVEWFQQQVALERDLRVPTDPYYGDQWHLDNTGQSGGTAGEDVNIVPAWNAGYTGTGVTVGVVEGGVESTHPDLAANHNPAGDLDLGFGLASHGTSVAGIIAANDDSKCGVGAAYDASYSSIDLGSSDAEEALALGHEGQINDIYNNSWGPFDDGARLEGPGPLTFDAIENNILNGRAGLGSIYVWAAGNGRGSNDDVNRDGYASSRYTIAVAATDHDGVISSYSEQGAATLVNAGSSSDGVGTTTTDRTGGAGYGGLPDADCTNGFGGTSSASPLAAGIIALMLEANPNLTWRDVQHILVETAERNHPTSPEWHQNGAGYWVHHDYGYGRIDAAAAVTAAANWTNVDQGVTYASPVQNVGQPIPDDGPNPGVPGTPVTDTFNVSGQGLTLEHVEVVLNATHSYRGDVRVELTSPSGTTSVMLFGYTNDSNSNIIDWRMMSTHFWGEQSDGTWTISVSDMYGGLDTGTFDDWQLILHGTESDALVLSNASFESPLGAEWSIVGDDDRFNTGMAQDGSYVMLFDADGITERISQTVSFSGSAGDAFAFSFYAGGQNLNSGGAVGARLELRSGSSTVDTVNCIVPNRGTFNWQLITCPTITATGSFDAIRISMGLRNINGGLLGFDNLSLTQVAP